jgi:signal transduction histidine kinase
MTIRSKLMTIGLIPVMLALIVLAAVFWTSSQMRRAREADRSAYAIVTNVFELNLTTDQYLRQPEARPRLQFESVHTALQKNLELRGTWNEKEEGLIKRMRESHQAMGQLFSLLVSLSAQNEFGNASSDPAELRERVVAQLLANSRQIVTDAVGLSQISAIHLDTAQRRGLSGILLIAAFSAAGMILLAALTIRSVLRPIDKLKEGAAVIALGDFGHRITIDSRDEVGELAATFNDMTGKLAKSHVSINLLETEITERKRAEESLKQAHWQLRDHARQLEETNKELERFAYTISHDLRAPLRAVSVFAHTLAEREAANLSDDGKQRLDAIEKNGVKMGQLIDDLLAFSAAGRSTMNIASIDMAALTEETLETLRMANDRDLSGVTVGSLPFAFGDPVLIRQVLINLLGNAVKFTRNKPERHVEIGSVAQDGETVYFVKDNGIGFDMQYYPKLFNVFERLVTDEEFEGSGVGLAIVHRLVTRHGGRVWAEGKPAEGATFYFSLPAKGTDEDRPLRWDDRPPLRTRKREEGSLR